MMRVNYSLYNKTLDLCKGSYNRLRWLHQNPTYLKWDTTLAEKAQAYAEKLVEINQKSSDVELPHSGTSGVGENLYWTEGADIAKCAQATLKW